MGTIYYIGQAIGILATLGSVLQVQMKKWMQILSVSFFVNLLSAANVLCLQGLVSGVLINVIGSAQCVTSYIDEKNGKDPGWIEKLVFFVLYVGLGMLGYSRPIDLLPIFAALLYMIAVFQKKEQMFRLLVLLNNITWMIYLLCIGSSLVLSLAVGMTSCVVGMIRFSKKKPEDEGEKE